MYKANILEKKVGELLKVMFSFFFLIGRKYVSGFVQKIRNKIISLIMKAAR